jgi:hypothetical protein
VVMRQAHAGGDKLFVDYAGDTVPVIIDRLTGKTRPAQIFVAVRAPPLPAAAASIGRSTAPGSAAERSRCRTPRRYSSEALHAHGASLSSLLASAPPLGKAGGRTVKRASRVAVLTAAYPDDISRNGERNHLGTPSDIKSNWRARSARIRGRLPPESAACPDGRLRGTAPRLLCSNRTSSRQCGRGTQSSA